MAFATLNTGHIGLNVTDVDRSQTFYQRVFGFEPMGAGNETGRRFAFLGREGKLVVTLWEQSAGSFETRSPGLHHLSFQVGSIDEVRAAEASLRELDVPLQYDGVVPHGEGADSGGLFFTDPDGIRLEIYTPSGAGGAAAPTPGAPTCGFF